MALAIAAVALASTGHFLATTVVAQSGYRTDLGSHPPPTSGPYAYSPPHGNFHANHGSFLTLGESYVDPVFGATITRISDIHPSWGPDGIYVKNGFWNADGTLFFSDVPSGSGKIINTTTGALVCQFGGDYDSSFSPVLPNIIYYRNGSKVMAFDTSTCSDVGQLTDPGGGGWENGSSVDWIDASGRYMVFSTGSGARFYDRQLDLYYSGTVTNCSLGGSWVGMAPDGSGFVGICSGRYRWYEANHTTRTLNATGFVFFNGGGGVVANYDHGDVLSASDGNTYLLLEQNDVFPFGISKFNVRENTSGFPEQAVNKADAPGMADLGMHISCVSRGPMQDWCLASFFSGNGSDDVGESNPTAGWYKYRDELFMFNALTSSGGAGEVVRRFAHHRTRAEAGGSWVCYGGMPRASVNWDGSAAMFASNFGAPNSNCYADIYKVQLGATTTTLAAPQNLRLVP